MTAAERWPSRLRHRFFFAWYTGTVVVFVGALLYLFNEAAGGVVVAVGLVVGFALGSLLLSRSKRLSWYRSTVRVRDLPIIAARRYDPATGWSRWAWVDAVLWVIVLAIIVAA
jgi:hypothetical protein